MSEFEIDFEWPVAKYDFHPAAAEDVSNLREMYQSEYYVYPLPIRETEWPEFLGRIVASGKAVVHRPKAEKIESAIELLVAGLDKNRKTPFHTIALRVAQALGAIGHHASGDYLFEWYTLAQRLRRIFEDKDLGKQLTWPDPARGVQRKGELGIYLVSGKDNKPVLALRPDGLEDALTFYAARLRATGTTSSICENCKAPFLNGGGRGGKKKRGDARFCSDECRYKFHNESRRKAR